LGFLTDRANILDEEICFEDFDEIKPPVSDWFEVSNYIPFSNKEKLYSGCRISVGNDIQKWLKAYDVLNGREVNGIISVINANKSKYNLIYLRDLEIRTAEKLKKTPQNKGFGLGNNLINSVKFDNFRTSGNESFNLKNSVNEISIPTITTATITTNTFTNTTYSSNYFKNTGTRPKTHFLNSYPGVCPTSTIQMTNPIGTDNSGGSDINSLVHALQNITINTQMPQKPKFYKIDQDPQLWLKAYERVCISNMWTDSLKVRNFGQNVCEEVVSWFSDNFGDIDLRLLRWKDLKYAFINEFQSRGRKLENCMRLNQIKQGNDESVRNYFRRAIELCNIVDEEMSEKAKVTAVFYGMKSTIRTHILNLGNWPLTENISDLMNFALNAESILELNSIIENKSIQKTNGNQYINTNQKNKYQRNFSPRNNQNKYKQNFDQIGNKNSNFNQHYYERNNESNSKRCFICNSEEHLARSCSQNQRGFSNNWLPKALLNEKYQSQNNFSHNNSRSYYLQNRRGNNNNDKGNTYRNLDYKNYYSNKKGYNNYHSQRANDYSSKEQTNVSEHQQKEPKVSHKSNKQNSDSNPTNSGIGQKTFSSDQNRERNLN